MALPGNPFSRKNRGNSDSGDNEPENKPEGTEPEAVRETDNSLGEDSLSADSPGEPSSAETPEGTQPEGSADEAADSGAAETRDAEPESVSSESSEEESALTESAADDADLLSDDDLDSIDSQVLENERQAGDIFPPPPLVDGPEDDIGEDGVPGASEENTQHLDEDPEGAGEGSAEDIEEESFESAYVSPEQDTVSDETDGTADEDLEQTRVHGFAPLPALGAEENAGDGTDGSVVDDHDPYLDADENGPPTRREMRAEQEAKRKQREKSKRNWIIFLVILVAALIAGAFWLYNAAMERQENIVIEQEEEEQIETVSVPSAIGFISAEDDDDVACEQYDSIGLECSVSYEVDNEIPRGNLISQTPDVGEFVEVGSTVRLTYSAGPETSEFPDINNESLEYVEETLWAMGVSIEDIDYTSGSGIPEDRVVEASVEPGDTVENGDSVIIYLSDGTVEIPDWTGETREDVENESEDLGVDIVFVSEESEEESEGTVLSQSDSGEVQFNDVIEITVAVPFASVEIEVPDILGLSPEEAQSDLAEAGFRSISTLEVSTDEVDEPTVTQVSPGVGGTGMSEERIVIVVSVPGEGNADTASADNTDDDAEGEEDTE